MDHAPDMELYRADGPKPSAGPCDVARGLDDRVADLVGPERRAGHGAAAEVRGALPARTGRAGDRRGRNLAAPDGRQRAEYPLVGLEHHARPGPRWGTAAGRPRRPVS